jgi:hypothetical protein
MPQIDLEDAIELRIEMLLEIRPGLEVDRSVQEGDWALLTLNDGGRLVGFEFLETEDSWTRPDALLQYFEAANAGFYVGIIVPSSALDDLTEMVIGKGEYPVTILTYDSIGIEDLITA